jgi:hypothetical protein
MSADAGDPNRQRFSRIRCYPRQNRQFDQVTNVEAANCLPKLGVVNALLAAQFLDILDGKGLHAGSFSRVDGTRGITAVP